MSATLHEAQANVGMSLARGGTGSAFAVETKLLFVEDGFEKLALPLWENQVGGFRRAPSLPKRQQRFRTCLWACTRHKLAPGKAGF